jgi:hypothetical protein
MIRISRIVWLRIYHLDLILLNEIWGGRKESIIYMNTFLSNSYIMVVMC